MQEESKGVRTGVTRGFSRYKAYEIVAPLIRPTTTASQLASWLGQQARQIQLAKTPNLRPDPRFGLPVTKSDNWTQEQVWMADEPAQNGKRISQQSRTSTIAEALKGMEPGQARSTIFKDYDEAHHWQASVGFAVKQLGWQVNKETTYQTNTCKMADGRFKLRVTRIS